MVMLEQPAYWVMLLIVGLWGGTAELELEPGQYEGEMIVVMDTDESGERHKITFTINDMGELEQFETQSSTLEREVVAEERGWRTIERTRNDPDQDFGPDDESGTGVAPQRMNFEREEIGSLVRLADPHAEGRHIYARPNLIVVEVTPEARQGDEPLLTTITFWPAAHASDGE